MDIKHCHIDDTTNILLLYDAARDLQTGKKRVVWPEFEASFIEKEIQEQKQWKIVMDQSHCMQLVHQF